MNTSDNDFFPRLSPDGRVLLYVTTFSLRDQRVRVATRATPDGEFLLFDGRVHTHGAVNRRIDNVVRGLIAVGVRQGAHVGVLMETRPSALVAIAALSRLGAVAVLMPPDADLAEAARQGGVADVIENAKKLQG